MIRAILITSGAFFGVPAKHRLELGGSSLSHVTGKWRIMDYRIAFEVEHGRWELRLFGLLPARWVTTTQWYEEEAVAFFEEFDHSRESGALQNPVK